MRALAHRIAALGCDDDVVSATLQRLAQVDLGKLGTVHVGGIEEIDADIDGGVDHGARARFIQSLAEVVAAEANLGNQQAAVAQSSMFHVYPV